jgi:hypothetical protein
MIGWVLLLALLAAAPAHAQDVEKARALARELLAALEPAPTPPTPTVLHVATAAELQAALTAAEPGDEIRIAASAVLTGKFIVPKKDNPAGQWITIRTDAADADLPPASLQPSPTAFAPYRAAFATLRPAPNEYALLWEPGASYYKLVGLFIDSPGVDGTQIGFGDWEPMPTTLEQLPAHAVIDTCWLDGKNAAKRGVAANGIDLTVQHSVITGIYKAGQDTQAVGGYNGAGPFAIVGNYLSASGENIIFGGSDPEIAGLVPSDITVRGNLVTKDLAWQAIKLSVKNLFELKNARRVVVDGNVFEYCWTSGQEGSGIVITVRNQSGRCPWCTVEDVTFSHNIVRHTANGVNILGHDDTAAGSTSGRAARIVIRDSLFYDVGTTQWNLIRAGSTSRDATWAIAINDGIVDSAVLGNTFAGPYSSFLKLSLGKTKTPSTNLQVRANAANEGKYGVIADGLAPGLASWAALADSMSAFDGNLLARTAADNYKYAGVNVKSGQGETIFDAAFALLPKFAREGLGAPLASLPAVVIP